MFLHQSVILFTGGCLPPPRADTHPLGRHPAPLGQTQPPWADTPPAQCMLGHRQQAGGTHPTGMQSCPKIYFYHPQTREGNVFTDVCQSFCGGWRGGVGIPGQQVYCGICTRTVGKRPVRIPLECFLVLASVGYC